MTVCVAALSSNGPCIICVADKALAYGNQIVWDSDSSKIIPLGKNEAVALTAGTERYIAQILSKIGTFDGYAKDRNDLIQHLESAYQRCFQEMQHAEVLHPTMLTRDEYVKAVSGPEINPDLRTLWRQVKEFNFDCELLICGYDKLKQPYIFDLNPPGVITDYSNTGFHAIGTGAEKALSHLLFVEHKRTHGVARTLYECFDAKAHAEMALGVGWEWDASFVYGGGAKPLDPEAKPLIDKVWARYNRSPFQKKREKDDLPSPPHDWEMQLRKFVAKSLGVASP